MLNKMNFEQLSNNYLAWETFYCFTSDKYVMR